MNIKRLKHLVALADERNFGRAAEQVHLSQPAFSRCLDRGASLAAYVFRHGRCVLAGAEFFVDGDICD
jgi:predicted DNA-binding protein (UPF0251 family)